MLPWLHCVAYQIKDPFNVKCAIKLGLRSSLWSILLGGEQFAGWQNTGREKRSFCGKTILKTIFHHWSPFQQLCAVPNFILNIGMKSVVNFVSLVSEMIRRTSCGSLAGGTNTDSESQRSLTPVTLPTGLAAAFQGYWGKQRMGNGNNTSGEVLWPLCVGGESALQWQSCVRAAATADLTPGSSPAWLHLKGLGSMVFMVHGPANSASSISRWAGTMLREAGGVSEA